MMQQPADLSISIIHASAQFRKTIPLEMHCFLIPPPCMVYTVLYLLNVQYCIPIDSFKILYYLSNQVARRMKTVGKRQKMTSCP